MSLKIYRLVQAGVRLAARNVVGVRKRINSPIEALEPRTMLSESATAQLHLLSTTPDASGNPVYHYDITVTDSGTTNIGTFWFAWEPGKDLLGEIPLSQSAPAGWAAALTGIVTPGFDGTEAPDGTAIQWVAGSNPITPGHALSGFDFTYSAGPNYIGADSPIDFSQTPELTSFIYTGAPEASGDPGYQFVVAPPPTMLAATTTSITTSNSNITTGVPVTFTATVAPASGAGPAPTGIVTFLQNGLSIGTSSLKDGVATLTTSTLPAGNLNVSAIYAGDNTYDTSSTNSFVETVSAPGATTATLTASTYSIQSGATVTFTAMVAPDVPNGMTPTGTFTFTVNGNTLATIPLKSDGTAQLITAALPFGQDAIVATYSGDKHFSASMAVGSVTVNVGSVATTISLTSSAAVVQGGNPVTFTAAIAPAMPGGPMPIGYVQFEAEANPIGVIGSATVQSNGMAVFTTSSLGAGNAYSIVAIYSGDTTYAANESSQVTVTVSVTPPGTTQTTTSLMTSAAVVQSGNPVTFTATITPVTFAGGPTPTGTVLFTEGGDTLGSAPVQSNGAAVLTTSSLVAYPATYTVTASYSGDATYAATTSNSVSVSVTPPALAPTIENSTVVSTQMPGVAAHGIVTVNIANMAAALKGKATLEVFASTDGTIDGSAIRLARTVKSVKLATGNSMVAKLPVRIAAGKLSAGSYTLLVRVIGPNGNNNDSSVGPTLTVAPAFVSLSETFTKTTIPITAVAGAKIHAIAILKITNNGNVTTPGLTKIALFATASGVVDSAATKINAVTKPLRIKPGKSATVNVPVKLIPAIAAGSYTIVAQVTDSNGNITTAISGVVNVSVS